MAVIGVHTLVYTAEPDAVRAIFSDIFGWSHVDAGDGWLIFATPPGEMGVHPAEAPAHEITLMCDDLTATVSDLTAAGLEVGEPTDEGFGVTATITLPGGLELMLYEPRHPTAI